MTESTHSEPQGSTPDTPGLHPGSPLYEALVGVETVRDRLRDALPMIVAWGIEHGEVEEGLRDLALSVTTLDNAAHEIRRTADPLDRQIMAALGREEVPRPDPADLAATAQAGRHHGDPGFTDSRKLDLLDEAFNIRDGLQLGLQEVCRAAVDYPGPAQDTTFVNEHMMVLVYALDSLRALMRNIGLGHDPIEQRRIYDDIRAGRTSERDPETL